MGIAVNAAFANCKRRECKNLDHNREESLRTEEYTIPAMKRSGLSCHHLLMRYPITIETKSPRQTLPVIFYYTFYWDSPSMLPCMFAQTMTSSHTCLNHVHHKPLTNSPTQHHPKQFSSHSNVPTHSTHATP